SGPLLGALLVIGVPTFVPLDAAGLAATQFGLLLIILYLPSGLGGLVEPLRDRIFGRAARRAGIADQDGEPEVDKPVEQGSVARPPVDLSTPVSDRVVPGHSLMLRAIDLHKSFGGVRAVDGVSFDIFGGETLGLIGPNGAGKTTTFELLSGFTSLDAGTVILEDTDITWMSPEQRGHLGLIRSFQDAALFPTMTVEEVVQLALERVAPTRAFASALGLPGNERQKRERSREIVSFMGLSAFRRKQIRELSTGTRRITELACLVALEPTLLLLDEPSSGIAQRETEQLGELLTQLKSQFGMTLLIIEHDIPLIMGLSDRMIAMADGRVIVSGTPAVVRDDQRVIDAYLGGSVAAIERSGAAPVGVG
ncbi:MAG: ABC transporter ATP-binding protein, partial [Actinobacteria bacterium]|nr:ABC transporter ATP-binding protein [Actinomycetota bacterium]